MKYIIGTEDFNKHVSEWLTDADQRSGQFLYNNRALIPAMFRNYTKSLFRGGFADQAFVNDLKANKAILPRHTSWSKDKKVALAAANDPYFKPPKESLKILIEKKFKPDQIVIDLDAFVAFMGIPQLEMQGVDELALDSALKEKEVLIQAKIKVTMKEVTFI